MRLHLIDYVFWCLSPVVMTAIAACILRKGLHREFPFFFNYIVFQVASFAVELPLHNWTNFFYVYWDITALNTLVTFVVLPHLCYSSE